MVFLVEKVSLLAKSLYLLFTSELTWKLVSSQEKRLCNFRVLFLTICSLEWLDMFTKMTKNRSYCKQTRKLSLHTVPKFFEEMKSQQVWAMNNLNSLHSLQFAWQKRKIFTISWLNIDSRLNPTSNWTGAGFRDVDLWKPIKTSTLFLLFKT